MQVDKFLLIDLALRLLLIDLHFATIQIGVIVKVCYTPKARLLSDLFISVYRIPAACKAAHFQWSKFYLMYSQNAVNLKVESG